MASQFPRRDFLPAGIKSDQVELVKQAEISGLNLGLGFRF